MSEQDPTRDDFMARVERVRKLLGDTVTYDYVRGDPGYREWWLTERRHIGWTAVTTTTVRSERGWQVGYSIADGVPGSRAKGIRAEFDDALHDGRAGMLPSTAKLGERSELTKPKPSADPAATERREQ